MKWFIGVLGILALVAVIVCSGCTGTAPAAQTAAPTTAPATAAAVVTTSAAATAAPVATSRTILEETFPIKSGYQNTYKTYSFADLGFQYLYPGDTFTVTVNADKPVNVLVIGEDDKIKLPSVTPEFNTVLKKDQWDYAPMTPMIVWSNVLQQTKQFTVKSDDKHAYYLVIDPRFASSEAGWKGTEHDDLTVYVKVTKP